ncbi:MAG: LytTR family DNA-binding domain-containing protein [Gammaproteobacteria bacterium]
MSTFVAAGQQYVNFLEQRINTILVSPAAVNGLVVICLTILLTVSDAFETGHLAVGHQITLWLVFSALLVSQLYGLSRILLVKYSDTFLRRVGAIGLTIALTVVLMTVELHLLKYTPLLPKQPDPFLEFLIFIAKPVIAVSALVLLSQLIPIQQQIKAYQLQALQTIRQSSAPQELDSILNMNCIQHVHAHDHYLEIGCTDQHFFVRGRMKDALAKLSDMKGIQVHRSHWVSRTNIAQVRREGRDLKLVLGDGSIVPVARSRAHLLAEWK